jgi:hypothetical protein
MASTDTTTKKETYTKKTIEPTYVLPLESENVKDHYTDLWEFKRIFIMNQQDGFCVGTNCCLKNMYNGFRATPKKVLYIIDELGQVKNLCFKCFNKLYPRCFKASVVVTAFNPCSEN